MFQIHCIHEINCEAAQSRETKYRNHFSFNHILISAENKVYKYDLLIVLTAKAHVDHCIEKSFHFVSN
jgi:hypothetical protein